MQATIGNPAQETARLEAPAPIYNCPQCSHYIAPGVLVCPECEHIIYSTHLREIALLATEQEGENRWEQARATWRLGLEWLPDGSRQHSAIVERIGLIDRRLQGQDETRQRWTKRLGPLAPVAFFLLKAKSALFLLFKLKFLLSFLGFFAIYWALFGWKFGLGFTVSILIHEMGHYIAARRRGLKVDMPVFIPGMGAYVRWYSMGVSLEDLSSIALAGPFFGLLVTVACAVLALVLQSPLFSALAHVTAWLNVLNLVPVLGLDGAQATYALDRTQRWLVLATGLIFFGMLHEWVFLFVALGMGWRLWKADFAEKPSTRTMLRFVLLLFALGVISYVFPDTTRR